MTGEAFFLLCLAHSERNGYDVPVLQPNTPLSELVSDAKSRLHETFQVEGNLFAAAPGRVNLIGEHIDYCDGFVLPLAIERYVVIAAKANNTSIARIASAGQDPVSIELGVKQEITDIKWSNYLRGVIQGFQDRGDKIPGFDAHIVSSLPLGAGLSSSAALECAFATLLEGLVDTVLATSEKALLAQKAEHDFAKVPCGIMDQYASAFGQEDKLILIDCRSGDPEMIPFTDPSLSIIVANTNISHDLSDGEYAKRRQDTEKGLAIIGKDSWRDVTMEDVLAKESEMGEQIFRRARHVVSEIQRTIDASASLKSDDFAKIGPLMADSHASLKDDFEVSCEELDLMVEIANEIGFEGGVLGTRMTGGGFGGSTVTLCRTSEVETIAKEMQEKYQAKTRITPLIFATRPAKGAHLL